VFDDTTRIKFIEKIRNEFQWPFIGAATVTAETTFAQLHDQLSGR